MTQDAEIRERLSEIWGAWTLTPDEALSDKLVEACGPVAAWLESGKNNPEIVIRAIQVLLADPESTTMNQRQSWKSLRKELSKLWPNAGTGKDHFFYVQALLLAAWPREATEGHFRVKHLLDSAWRLWQDNVNQRQSFMTWRLDSVRPRERATKRFYKPSKIAVVGATGAANPETATPPTQQSKPPARGSNQRSSASIDAFRAITEQANAVKTISDEITSIQYELARLKIDLGTLGTSFVKLNQELQKATEQWDCNVDQLLETTRGQLNLLWWGQSRYCRALGKPYRRLKADQPALLWWTAREAAEFAQSVEVEPAAAYLVQTLENLGQSVGDEKAVVEWMQLLYTALVQSAEKVPALSKRLDQIAKEDALGLPVTWVRRQVMQNKPFDDKQAREDVALPLDTRIDLGDWASWIFRETLLDLHLADTQS